VPWRVEGAALCGGWIVVAAVQTYRLLYFRDALLEDAQEVQARDLLEAIGKAAGQPPDVRVEVWSDKGRVGVLRTSPLK
jgi:hypothetical protein